MNIGIDARLYGNRHGGIGRYTEQLISHLLMIDHKNSYTFFVHPNNPQIPHSKKHTSINAPFKAYSWEEQTKFAQLINTSNIRFLHAPHWNIPICITKPFIATIHDLILLHHPNRKASTLPQWKYALKFQAFKLALYNATQRASHIITVSNHAKQDIANTLKIPNEAITAIHLGAQISHTPTQKNLISQRNNPYMLMVGVQYPHKNHAFIIEVFKKLTEDHIQNMDLVIAGPTGPFTKDMHQLIDQANTELFNIKSGKITFIANAPDAHLQNLYKNASLLLFPSLYEGFGLPPIEAMLHGVPVIASNTSSIPEICQNNALLADPHDQTGWINAINTINTDHNLKQSLISRGYIHAQKFSWHTCAKKTFDTYNKHFG